jgi:hypothetical protein
MRTTLTVLTLIAGLGFAACAKEADKAAAAVDQKAKTLEINSKWISNCKNVTLDAFGIGSETEDFDFGASLSKTTLLFQENNCVTATVRITENGSYVVGNKLVNSDAYELNQHFDSVAIMPMNDAGVTQLNLIQACGINDWAVGVQRDVTAKSSDSPVIDRCWAKTPRDLYDIALISTDKLTFGLEKDGKDRTAAEKRPTEIDGGVVFTKH